jgi:hypothetical protein
MNRRTIHIVSVGLLFLTAPAINAQKNKAASSTQATTKQSVNIVDSKFVPVLESSDRILVLPEVDNPQTEKRPIVYLQKESPASLNGEYTPLPAAEILTELPSSNELGYFRLGVGNHRTFLGDMQLNLIRQSSNYLDVSFRHRSVYGDVILLDDLAHQAYYADNDLQSRYKGFIGKVMLEVGLGEQFRFWNNYGVRESFGIDTLNMKGGQWSTDGQFRFRLTSLDLDNPISWTIGSVGHLFRLGKGVSSTSAASSKTRGGTERDFCLDGSIRYNVNEQLNVNVDARIRNFSYKAPTSFDLTSSEITTYSDLSDEFEDRSYLEFEPSLRYLYKNWRFTGGLKFSVPSLVSESVRPNIVATAITDLNEKVVVKATLDGGVNTLSYREGFDLNPYLDPSKRLRASWKPYDINVVVDYKPDSYTKISPEIGFNKTKDAPFFYNCLPFEAGINKANGRFFGVKYMTSTELHLGVEAHYASGSDWSVQGGLRLNKYVNTSDDNLIDGLLKDNGRKAWYKPGIVFHLRPELTASDKISVYMNYQYEGLRYAPTRTDKFDGSGTSDFCHRLDAISNMSIGANYNVRKGVGIFLHVDNLLDNRYEGYYGFPVHGFAAVMGGSVSF